MNNPFDRITVPSRGTAPQSTCILFATDRWSDTTRQQADAFARQHGLEMWIKEKPETVEVSFTLMPA
jgi:hypothetical protein